MNGICPVGSTADAVTNEPVGLCALRRPSEECRRRSDFICDSMEALRIYTCRDILHDYIVNDQRSIIHRRSRHLDSYILTGTRVCIERYELLGVHVSIYQQRIQRLEGSSIRRIGHHADNSIRILIRVIFFTNVELDTLVVQTDQLRQDRILINSIGASNRQEVQCICTGRSLTFTHDICTREGSCRVCLLDIRPAKHSVFKILVDRLYGSTLGERID